jgi:hypothetical protein
VGNAGAHLREAFILAKKAGLDHMMIAALLVNVRTSFDEEQDSDLEKIELLEYAGDLLGDTPALRARVLGALAVELIFVGDPVRRRVLLDEARELARRSNDPVALIDVSSCNFLARPRSSWSASAIALDRGLYAETTDEVTTLGDPHWMATVQSQSVAYAFISGDGESLRAHVTALGSTGPVAPIRSPYAATFCGRRRWPPSEAACSRPRICRSRPSSCDG